jgi:hypothetical protein
VSTRRHLILFASFAVLQNDQSRANTCCSNNFFCIVIDISLIAALRYYLINLTVYAFFFFCCYIQVNPLRGYRKLLKVGYVARGLTGTMRLPDVGGKLVADVYIGYPPQPPPEPLQLGPTSDATAVATTAAQGEIGGGGSAPPMKVGLSTAGRKGGVSKTAKPNKYEEFMVEGGSSLFRPKGSSSKPPATLQPAAAANTTVDGSKTPPSKTRVQDSKKRGGNDDDDDDDDDDLGPSDLVSLDESAPLSDEKGLLVSISGLAAFGSGASVGSNGGDEEAEPTHLGVKFEAQANIGHPRGVTSPSSSSSSSSSIPSSWTPSTRRQAKQVPTVNFAFSFSVDWVIILLGSKLIFFQSHPSIKQSNPR